MKRLAATILMALLAALPAALSEDMREFYNPEGYTVMYVMEIFTSEDIPPNEKGDFPTEGFEPEILVQCCFGEFDFSGGEWDVKLIGFDEDDVFSLGLAEGCEVFMPPDFDALPDVSVCEDLQAWYDMTREEMTEMGIDAPYQFYAHFDMNEEGLLTRLEYVYVPFN